MSAAHYTLELTLEAGLEARVAAAALDLHVAERAVVAVLQAEAVAAPVEVGLLLADDARLQTLNAAYRGCDEPTDVLSFADDGPPTPFVGQPGAPRYLGDIAISLDRVFAQAAAYDHSPARELAYLAAHATLHLLGYDHERGPAEAAAMRSREEAAMTSLGLTR